MSRTYTKEEKTKIYETMQSIVEDMFKVFDHSNTTALKIRLDDYISLSEVSTLIITKSKIKLITYREAYEDMYGELISMGYVKDKTYVLGTRLNKAKSTKTDLDIMTEFINNYQAIRDVLYDESKTKTNQKDDSLKGVEDWYNRFKRETAVEFELPPTNNQYRVEVSNENGQTIGTFYFGDKTINIITNGEMNFIDKRTGEKVKTK